MPILEELFDSSNAVFCGVVGVLIGVVGTLLITLYVRWHRYIRWRLSTASEVSSRPPATVATCYKAMLCLMTSMLLTLVSYNVLCPGDMPWGAALYGLIAGTGLIVACVVVAILRLQRL